MNYVLIPEMGDVKLRYDFNAMCDLEDVFGSLDSLFKDKRVFNSTRALLWIGSKWDRPGMTMQDAGDLIAKYMESGKNLEDLSAHINTALLRSGVVKKEEIKDSKN